MIAIINLGSGNIEAFKAAFNILGKPHKTVETLPDLEGATKIILPGIGTFDETMKKLNNSGLRSSLENLALKEKVPFLGVCVGMQIFGTKSEEGALEGLGWIQGTVRALPKKDTSPPHRLPHMGWNSVRLTSSSPLFHSVNETEGFYFLHNYHFECSDEKEILTTTNHGVEFTSSIRRKNIFGVQFHPEKSHDNGMNLLRNFADL